MVKANGNSNMNFWAMIINQIWLRTTTNNLVSAQFHMLDIVVIKFVFQDYLIILSKVNPIE